MHMNRSPSSSILPSLCSLHTLIGIAVMICVFFTLHTSISLQDKSLPSQDIKFDLPPPRLLDYSNEISLVDQSPPNSDYQKDNIHYANQPPPYSLHSKQETILLNNISSPNKLEEIVGGLAKDFDITWGDHRGKFHENGTFLTLSLDKYSGSGFQSKNEYLFAKIDIKIKLIPGNSAGTVTTFYMSSNETAHDEIDFEFLGNVSGQPYTVHTNVYTKGKGNREKQFYLWFDPTEDFHIYSILWNPARIVFFVDDVPIREFKNMEDFGVPYPNKQPMRIYSSLWNANDWATQGGRVHTDWSKAPFVASYKDFSISACVWSFGSSSCGLERGSENSWLREELDAKSLEKMRWAQKSYMTYNYCNDKWRFYEKGLPKECTIRVPRRGRRY